MIALSFADQEKEQQIIAHMKNNNVKWCAKIFQGLEAAALVHDHISAYIKFRNVPYAAFRISEIVIVKRIRNEKENTYSSQTHGT